MSSVARARIVGIEDPPTQSEASVLGRAQPVCNFVNAEAARLRNQFIAIALVCLIGAVALPLLAGIGDPRIPLVLAAGAIGFVLVRARTELRLTCATIAVKRVVAALDAHLAFRVGSSLTREQLLATDLFDGIERVHSRDEIGGRSRGLRYTVHRVKAGRRRATVFDGVVIRVDCTEVFPGLTVIVPDRATSPTGTRVKKDLVLLKHPAFEQAFSVLASDYYSARRIVTPAMMELVMEAAAVLGTDVRLAFVGRWVFAAIAGESMRTGATLFGPPLTPRDAVGRLMHVVGFAERLAGTVAA